MVKIAAATGIIINNDKILSVRSIKRGKLGFPGGKKLELESPLECLIREVKEETSISVIDAIYLNCVADTTWHNNLVALFLVKQWEGTISSSSEGEALWVSWQDLINPDTSFFPVWNSWAYEQYLTYNQTTSL